MPTLNGFANAVGNGVSNGFALPAGVPPTVGGIQNWYTPNPVKGDKRLPLKGAPFGPSVKLNGFKLKLFGELFWYEHIHLIPQQFNLGNILADLTRSFEVYNGNRATARTVTTIDQINTAGITITAGSTSVPLTIPPNQSLPYTLTISRLGPVKLNAAYDFAFASGEIVELTLTGTRAIVWPFVPQAAFTERYEYASDVMTSDDGTEQRQALRDTPRALLSYRYRFGDEEINSRVENLLADWHARVFALPIWQDYATLSSTLASGGTAVSVASLTDRDFRAGAGELILLYANENSFEALEVSSIVGTTINVSVGPTSTWPAGTKVLPIRLCFVRGAAQQDAYVTAMRDVSLQFEALSQLSFADETAFSTYQGAPLLLDAMREPDIQAQRVFGRDLLRADSRTGRAFQKSTRRFSPMSQGFFLDFDGRTEQWRLKRFLQARKGMVRSFWVPTWRNDFAIQAPATAPTNTIFVKAARYSDQVFGNSTESRKHIMIEYVNGVRDFRKITGASVTSPGILETLTLDSNVTQNVTTGNVVRISFMQRVRLSTDTIEFRHDYTYTGEVALPIMEVDL